MLSLANNYITRGFWGDEAWTSLISQLPYLQMLKTTAADFHPPAYYTIIEIWYRFFPPTEVSTRIVSVIFYFLTGFLVYKIIITILRSSATSWPAGLKLVSFISTSRESKPTLEVITSPSVILEGVKQPIGSHNQRGSIASLQNDKRNGKNGKKRWFGLNPLGLISVFVVLTNPIFFQYAFEARNYTMFAFAACGSMYFLIRILNKSTSEESEPTSEVKRGVRRWDAFGFILFSTLGIYTHYYMFFTLAAQGLFILIWERKFLLKMTGMFAVVGLLYLPWIPFLLSQVTSVGENYWIGAVGGRTHFEAILRIIGGEQQNVFRPVLFWLATMLILIGLLQHLRQKSFEKPYILVWLWATVPFILASLPGLKVGEIQLPFRPIFFWRYLIGAAVPMSIVIVHAAQKLPARIFALTLAAVFVLSLAINWLTLTRYPRTFAQIYENEISGQIKPGDKIVTVLPSFAEVLYYRNRFGLENQLIVLPEGLIQHSGKSLLDAYAENGVVTIGEAPESGYFELRPGPRAIKVDKDRFPLEKQSVK